VFAANANALLRGGSPFVVADGAAEKDIFELVHPRIIEEERRVVMRHDGRRGDDCMSAVLKIFEETAADLLGLHRNLMKTLVQKVYHIPDHMSKRYKYLKSGPFSIPSPSSYFPDYRTHFQIGKTVPHIEQAYLHVYLWTGYKYGT
jgi:hypothetical protein